MKPHRILSLLSIVFIVVSPLSGQEAIVGKPEIFPDATAKAGDNPAFIDKAGIALAEPFDLRQVRLLDGIFKAAQVADEKFLLSLDPDRLLHNFRINAKLPSTSMPYGGWEAPGFGIRGHFTGHYLSACAEMYASTGDGKFNDRGRYMVAELAKCQAAMGTGYLSAFPSSVFDRIETKSAAGSSAPYYAVHKIMAGLLDQYHYCGNQQAIAVLCRMADYFKGRLSRLTPDQIESALFTSNAGPQPRHEMGGMSEVIHNLYAVTGKPEYLELANTFDRAWFLDPLANGKDQLSGEHANTHIPEVTGFARRYEVTGDERYRHAAEFFWTQVTRHHSYVTGGNSRGEVFLKPDEEANALRDDTAETCNVYNMLKLTQHLFTWKADVPTADYDERAIYNHILSSIDSDSGAMAYYLSLKPGHYKLYGTLDTAFWCCTGTGIENHARYGNSIYFHHADALWVNLFIPSRLSWEEKGVSLIQNTNYPADGQSTLTFTTARPTRLKLLLRYPGWARLGATVSINGQEQRVTEPPGTFISIDRAWQSGDEITLNIPLELRLYHPIDNARMIAIMYGPVVLAGTSVEPASHTMTKAPTIAPSSRNPTQPPQFSRATAAISLHGSSPLRANHCTSPQ